MSLRIFNTLSRNVEEFHPRIPGKVSMYTCGPTVYRDAHIGNLRSYLMADWVRRVLEYRIGNRGEVFDLRPGGHGGREYERGTSKERASL